MFKDMTFVVDVPSEEAKRLLVEQIVGHGGKEVKSFWAPGTGGRSFP